MNITPFTIYIWQLADDFRWTFNIIYILFWIASFFTLTIYLTTREDKDIKLDAILYRCFRWFIPLTIIGMVISIMIPKSNTVAMMIVIPRIAESKVIQQELPELYNIAIEALKSSLKQQTK